jgi:hypothetical protein
MLRLLVCEGAVALGAVSAAEVVNRGWSDHPDQPRQRQPGPVGLLLPRLPVRSDRGGFWMKACPAVIIRAQRSCLSPRIARNRDFNRP